MAARQARSPRRRGGPGARGRSPRARSSRPPRARPDAARGPAGRGVDDFVARIEREHREPGGHGGVDVGSGLQVVAVRTEGPAPSPAASPGDRCFEDVLERPARPFELARRLLREDRNDMRAGDCQPGELTGRREPEAVAEAEGRCQTERLWSALAQRWSPVRHHLPSYPAHMKLERSPGIGGPDATLTSDELASFVHALAGEISRAEARNVLLVPPDQTRLHSRAGEIVAVLATLLDGEVERLDVMPAAVAAGRTMVLRGVFAGEGGPTSPGATPFGGDGALGRGEHRDGGRAVHPLRRLSRRGRTGPRGSTTRRSTGPVSRDGRRRRVGRRRAGARAVRGGSARGHADQAARVPRPGGRAAGDGRRSRAVCEPCGRGASARELAHGLARRAYRLE